MNISDLILPADEAPNNLTMDEVIEGGNGGGIDAKSIDVWTTIEVWGYGFLFVTIINLSSIMGIIFFPLMKKSFYAILMRIMIGLAIGSLSGSALFHLIPQAFGINESHPNYMQISSFVWLAIWIVMILECSIKIGVKMRAKSKMRKAHRRATKMLNKHNNNPSHLKPPVVNGCGPPPQVIITPNELDEKPESLETDEEDANDEVMELDENQHFKMSDTNLPVYRSTLSLSKIADKMSKSKDMDDDDNKKKEIKTVAWIIIIGDSLHNFIDGVSIGAGFVQSFSTGAVLSLAIMCEEFPHELGDFAILINSGLSVKKALLFNFLSALTCYLGLGLGILLGEIEWANLIFAFAAGIFLYVALGDMVPEVTSLIDEVSDVSPKRAWKVMFTHNIGILIGISILYILAKYQPS